MLPNFIFKIERWKFNKDYGVYVSTLGRFKDRYKRLLPIKVNTRGYCAVDTECGSVFAHRLVMFTWRPIPNAEVLTVDHLNHNKRDNSLENLEWVTREENLRRAERDFISIKSRAALPIDKWSNKIYAQRHYFLNKTTGEYFEDGFSAAEWTLRNLGHNPNNKAIISGAENLASRTKKSEKWHNYEWEAILNENLVN